MGRPYDLRHAAFSTWLNAGVPAAQVAEWAGHSVDVLLRVYVKCIAGQQGEAKRRIEDAMGTPAGDEPGSKAPQMQCPECEEPAVNHPATDRVPWEAHGLDRPEWSHADGSALCPVIGTSGGYEPAQPNARSAAPDPRIEHEDPPVAARAPRSFPAADYEPEAG